MPKAVTMMASEVAIIATGPHKPIVQFRIGDPTR